MRICDDDVTDISTNADMNDSIVPRNVDDK